MGRSNVWGDVFMSTIYGTNAGLYINGVAMEEDAEHIAKLIESIERREEMGRECLERIAKAYLGALEKIVEDTSAECGQYGAAYMNLKAIALRAIGEGYNIRDYFVREMMGEL
jgi:hypothetical protein